MLGCWETLGALGIPDFLPWLPIDKIWNKKYEFSDFTLSPVIENAFNAVAIDEKRKAFSSTPMKLNPQNPRQELEEVWFVVERLKACPEYRPENLEPLLKDLLPPEFENQEQTAENVGSESP